MISIVAATENPIDVIGIAAGTSYGRPLDEPQEKREKRVRHCISNGHLSVLEQASVTFRCECSRACSHQLVRHRIASYCQKSQRYTKIDTTSNNWFVMPHSFATCMKDIGCIDGIDTRVPMKEAFKAAIIQAGEQYNEALRLGIKPEDARYLLPEATKTEITVTMNVRALYHFLDMRTDSHAQWEIRDLANELWQEVAKISDQWAVLMGLWSLGEHS